MSQDLGQTIPLAAAIRALEQATGPEEILAATIRLQSVLEQLGTNSGAAVQAMTVAAARAVDAAIAMAQIQHGRFGGTHPAAASVAAAYRHNKEARP